MAFASKYNLTFCDIKGQTISMTFFEDGYVGDTIDLVGADDPLVIEWESKDGMFSTTMPSKATIRLKALPSGDYDSSNFSLDDERQMYVYAYAPAGDFQWWGWVLPEDDKKPLQEPPYTFMVNAVDLFTVIKGLDIASVDGTAFPSTSTLYGLLSSAINRGVRDTSDNVMKTVNTLYPVGASSDPTSAYDDPFLQVVASGLNFIDNNLRWLKCDKVINSILKVYCARMVFSNSKFYVQRIPDIAKDSAIIERTLQVSPLALTIDTAKDYRKDVTCDTTDPSFIIRTPAEISTQRAVKEQGVHFKYKNYVSSILNPLFLEYNPSTTAFTNWSKEGGITVTRIGTGRTGDPYKAKIEGLVNLGSIPSDSQRFACQSSTDIEQDRVLNINIKGRMPAGNQIQLGTDGNPLPYFAPIQISIKNGVDTYYLKLPNINGVREWTTDNLAYNSILFPSTDGSFKNANFKTQPTPISGTVVIKFLRLYTNKLSWTPSFTPNQWWELSSVQMNVEIEDNKQGIDGEYHYFTQAGDFSYIPELEEVEFGDTMSNNIAGTLCSTIFSYYGNIRTKYWYRNGVDAPLTSNMGILGHMAKSYVNARKRPTKQFRGVVRSNTIYPHNTLKFKDAGGSPLVDGVFMITRDKYNVKRAEHDIDAVEILPDVAVLSGEYNSYYDYKD